MNQMSKERSENHSSAKKKSVRKQPTAKQIAKQISLYNSAAFEQEFTCTDAVLGTVCNKSKTSFFVWSPQAQSIVLCLCPPTKDGHPNEKAEEEQIPLKKSSRGIWSYERNEMLHGMYYRYLVTINDQEYLITDPYARACSANGKFSMVVNLALTNPEGWEKDYGPALLQPTDAVIYELHLRDLSMDFSAGISHKGLFLGLAEKGTKNTANDSTGLDHIKKLGVTHIHLLPCFDFCSVDETAPSFNWGYDPANYNIPEGSYSSDPDNGTVRIREMKEMIHALHKEGLGVIMDVVYNHTAFGSDSHFNRLVPYYYYRMNPDGSFSNGSACGNETASERPMMRAFMVDSVAYWAEEYHIDGFRFDLMGLHDIETMQAIRARLDAINPQILIYGEGWMGGESPLEKSQRATKENLARIPGIAAFNDNLRDAIKGSVFEARERGFASGKKYLCNQIRFGICGCAPHPQIDLKKLRLSEFWAASPAQCINYVSAHDNLTLWDKLTISHACGSKKQRIRMNNLAAAIYLTAQGIPFFLAGEEFLRSKPAVDGGFDENSYCSPDRVNAINWKNLTKYHSVYEYYRGLIALRKAHPAFRLKSAEEIAAHLSFLPESPETENTVGYLLSDHAGGDELKEICVLFNPNRIPIKFSIPYRMWNIYANAESVSNTPLGTLQGANPVVEPISCLILGQ